MLKTIFKKFQRENAKILSVIQGIDGFSIKPSNFKISTGRSFTGHIASYDNSTKTVVLKIDDGFNDMVKTYYNEQKYDITFESSRLSFQLQHEALKYVKEHRLFQILIKNPEFKMCSKTFAVGQESKRVSNISTLNKEQNLAVNNILVLGDSIPFLLFGPPGKN